jgi:thiamine monophosphate kinase
VIGESSLPVLDSVRRRGTGAVIRAAGKGEEFELLACLRPQAAEELCPEMKAALGIPLTPIGRILADPGRMELIDRAGSPRPFPATGYRHF